MFAALTAAQDLRSLLESNADLSSFLEALQRVPDLLDTLSSSSNITIFAPLNSAFEAIGDPTTSLEIVSGDNDTALANLLSYHVLYGTWSADDLSAGGRTNVHTMYDNGLVTGGQIVAVSGPPDQLFVDSGTFIPANVIDTVESYQSGSLSAMLISGLEHWRRGRGHNSPYHQSSARAAPVSVRIRRAIHKW
jgi:uncharacterized surface protein with fasciclin (FAS1) repeats